MNTVVRSRTARMGVIALIAGLVVSAAAVAEPGGRGGYGYHGGGYGGWHGGYRGWYGGYGWGCCGLAFGLYFSALPLYYSTLWWGGVPYYYAANNFYVWNGAVGAYETVNPPAALVSQAGAMQAPASPDLIVYPNNGQTSEQQAKDRYECHRWAANQTGFDPTLAGVSMAGVGQPPAAAADQPPGANAGQSAAANAGQSATHDARPAAAPGKREDYLRAQAACLEGRGYTAR